MFLVPVHLTFGKGYEDSINATLDLDFLVEVFAHGSAVGLDSAEDFVGNHIFVHAMVSCFGFGSDPAIGFFYDFA